MTTKKCKNCETTLRGKFCSNCGQKVMNVKDKSLKNLFREVFHFLTSFDGKILYTLKTIYLYPGKLSRDYCNGISQRYYKPISFYLLIVILYLMFPIASGMNMEMKYYKGTPILGKYISNKIEYKQKTENLSEDLLSKKFYDTSKNTSKFLLLLLIPLPLPLIYLLSINKKQYAFDNFILLTEINIFFLLTFFILIPIIIFPLYYFFNINLNDEIFVPLTFLLFSFYSIKLFQKVYNEKFLISILKGIIFCVLFLFIIVAIYRPLVFEITFALL